LFCLSTDFRLVRKYAQPEQVPPYVSIHGLLFLKPEWVRSRIVPSSFVFKRNVALVIPSGLLFQNAGHERLRVLSLA